ncbi:DUF2127 domain-containing protein [Roseovarius indicus]|uniref:DUF2127 domain-containing protein n=1 Tax=Roseovarius indicus TaxID=540747 RepID=UPI00405A29B8
MEDPGDLVAGALRRGTEGFGSDAQSFVAWYLFGHGAIKLALVVAVLANRSWAYAPMPTSFPSMSGRMPPSLRHHHPSAEDGHRKTRMEAPITEVG